MTGAGAGAVEEPYRYFMSAPRARARPGGPRGDGPGPWVVRFHRDLRAAVARCAGLADERSAGRLNLAGPRGGTGDRARAEAIDRSRVLVPLYSPEFFRDVRCGREWWAFARRMVPDEDPTRHVVPVLWQPVPDELLPRAARRVRVEHARFGDRYAQVGLGGLIGAERLREPYREALEGLARLIVQRAAAAPPWAPPPQPPDLSGGPGLFGLSPAAPALRVLVAAGRAGAGPAWHPYRAAGGRPPAQEVLRLAADLDYAATVGALRPGEPPARDGSARLTLLLLDPPALLDDGYRDEVALFVRRSLGGPLAILVPWDAAAAEGTDDEPMRRVREVMAPWLSRRRPRLRSLPLVVPDPESFALSLEQELRAAAAAAARSSGPPVAPPPSGPPPVAPPQAGPPRAGDGAPVPGARGRPLPRLYRQAAPRHDVPAPDRRPDRHPHGDQDPATTRNPR